MPALQLPWKPYRSLPYKKLPAVLGDDWWHEAVMVCLFTGQ